MAENHRTEAACLLEQGASYHKRIGLVPIVSYGDPVFAGFKHGAFSLYFGDAPIYHFDLEGRWQRAFLSGTHYLKGLDATIHAIDRPREGINLVLKRRSLSRAEASDIDERIRSTAKSLIARLDGAELRTVNPPSPRVEPIDIDDLRAFLELIGSWDAAAWLAHRERYKAAYGALPYLPPECQNAVVVQATGGNAAGVGFGGVPSSQASVRSPAEFKSHTDYIAKLWGRRLWQSRIVFLAGSDVLHCPIDNLTAFLDAIGRVFPIEPRSSRGSITRARARDNLSFDGVHAFIDDFAVPVPDEAGWRELAARGLVRIAVGVESGDADVRRLHGKSWSDDNLRSVVSAVKAAGLGASVLTLVGAGGLERAESHVASTAQLIASLELSTGDFVFLLDEKEIRGAESSPTERAIVDGSAWSAEQSRLKETLAPLKKRGIKVLPYTVDKQWR
jgi:hypothetical protein